MTKSDKAPRIFISYSSKDKGARKAISNALAYKGVVPADAVFSDSSAIPWDPKWKGSLKARIQSSSMFATLWNAESVNSPAANYELGMADALGKPIVFVIPSGAEAPVPSNLADARVLKVSEKLLRNFEKGNGALSLAKSAAPATARISVRSKSASRSS